MKYLAELTTSRATALALEAGPLTFTMGPWRRLKYAKRRVAEYRRERALYDWGDGPVDCGPAYSRVRLLEAGE